MFCGNRISYERHVQAEPNTPGECLTWMEKNWHISEKEINIISPHFHMASLSSFKPFDYQRNSPEDYYSVYNAIKHDRARNISKATVYTLVRAFSEDKNGTHASMSARCAKENPACFQRGLFTFFQ